MDSRSGTRSGFADLVRRQNQRALVGLDVEDPLMATHPRQGRGAGLAEQAECGFQLVAGGVLAVLRPADGDLTGQRTGNGADLGELAGCCHLGRRTGGRYGEDGESGCQGAGQRQQDTTRHNGSSGSGM